VRSLTVCDGEVLPGVCAPDGAVCRAVSGSAIRDFPESYTPKRLAEKILTSKSALEGGL
jgi:hypothetical protein